PNGDALRKCILEGPYTPSIVTILAVPATDESLEVPERIAVETILNIVGTPMATKPKLDADLSGKLVKQTNYRSMIGSLMYLISSRPDIVQAGTINMGLWYPKDSGFELTAFLDADHAGCLDTRKSTSGGIQFLAEAEYMALSASCAQVMWMRTQLKDYGFNYNKNTVVLRLLVSHSNLMQPRAALPYQAHPYSLLFYHGTG
ncbi:retrovirus-related pol polyprotein from transposon TNT 1-94, partial [Tanacetum coccineum]